MKLAIILKFYAYYKKYKKYYNIDYFKYLISFFEYKKLKKQSVKDSNLKIIFKFDDLNGLNLNILRLDKCIKKENIKVCFGIIVNSLLNPDKHYVEFIQNNNNKNYSFFNHGYTHLGGPDYEFHNQLVEEQENAIKKTQEIVFEKTGIILNAFGAPCNKIDDNTRIALEKISEIKHWFYGMENYNANNIKRTIKMENRVGNLDFEHFKKQWVKLDYNDNIYIVLQGHPNMWNLYHFLQFKCIVQFLKNNGCLFIFPDEINKV